MLMHACIVNILGIINKQTQRSSSDAKNCYMIQKRYL